MNLSKCPRCDETVRLPESPLPERARAKCPWCMEMFPIAEIAEQLPPVVELFDEAGVPIGSLATVAAIPGVPFAESPSDDARTADAATLPFESDDDADDEGATDSEPSVPMIDSAAETWTEDGSSTTKPFSSTEETVVFDTELEQSAPTEAADLESFDDEAGLEESSGNEFEQGELEVEDFEEAEPGETEPPQQLPDSHDFRIEESGPISEDDYEIVSEQNTAIDAGELHGGLAPMRVKSGSRRKPKRSSARTLLGIALGPVLALPIAGIIFYLLGTDLGFWPLDGGRSSSPNVSASPPVDISHFDPKPGEDSAPAESDDLSASQASPEPVDEIPEMPAPAGEELASVNSTESSTMPPPKDEKPIGQNSGLGQSFWVPDELNESVSSEVDTEEPLSMGSLAWKDSDASTASFDDANPSVEAAADQTDLVELADELPETTPMPEPSVTMSPVSKEKATSPPEKQSLRTKNTPRTDDFTSRKPADTGPDVQEKTIPVSTELTKAIDDARKQLKKLSEIANASKSSKQYKAALAWTYAKLADVGAMSNGSSNEEVNALVDELKQSPQLDDFAAATPIWLRATNRTSNGTILIGRPESTADGPTVTLPSGTKISVVTDSVAMPSGNKVVALGQIQQESPIVVVRLVAAVNAN